MYTEADWKAMERRCPACKAPKGEPCTASFQVTDNYGYAPGEELDFTHARRRDPKFRPYVPPQPLS